MSDSVHVVARMQVRPGQEETLRALIQAVIEPTRRDPGYRRYELMQSNQDPTWFALVEEWESDAALDAHIATAHIQEAMRKLPQVLAGPPDVVRYRRVA